MPTLGFGLSTDGLRAVSASVSYRRSMSGAPDGLYPPGGDRWSVNEESLVVAARGRLPGGRLVPFAAARWSFVLAQIDEALAGVRIGLGPHAVTAEASRTAPAFDADSIFNVFGGEPTTDFRLGADLWPGRGRLRAHVHALARRFEGDGGAWSAGGGASARLALSRGFARLDLFYEDGYGGLRAGGDAATRISLRSDVRIDGRVTAIRFEDELRPGLEGFSLGVQAGALWVLTPGVGLEGLLEENTSPVYASQLRAMLVLDLAFQPEL